MLRNAVRRAEAGDADDDDQLRAIDGRAVRARGSAILYAWELITESRSARAMRIALKRRGWVARCDSLLFLSAYPAPSPSAGRINLHNENSRASFLLFIIINYTYFPRRIFLRSPRGGNSIRCKRFILLFTRDRSGYYIKSFAPAGRCREGVASGIYI